MIHSCKAQFQNQTFFAILMLVVFVGILIYGYNSITSISNTLNDEELAELRQTILSQTGICAQSSQRGRLETLEISANDISHVCYISNSSQLSSTMEDLAKERGLTQNHTIFLLNGPQDVDFTSITSIDEINEFVIYDIIPLKENAELADGNNCQIREGSEFEYQFTC
jgi:hypothetical protein